MSGLFGRNGALNSITKGAQDYNRAAGATRQSVRQTIGLVGDAVSAGDQTVTYIKNNHARKNNAEANVINSETRINQSKVRLLQSQDQLENYPNQRMFAGGTNPMVPANSNNPLAGISKDDIKAYNKLSNIDAQLAGDTNLDGKIDAKDKELSEKKIRKLTQEKSNIETELNSHTGPNGDSALQKLDSLQAQKAADNKLQAEAPAREAATIAFGEAMKEANIANLAGDTNARFAAEKKALESLKGVTDSAGNIHLEPVAASYLSNSDPKSLNPVSPVALMAQVSAVYAGKDVGKAIPQDQLKADQVNIQLGKNEPGAAAPAKPSMSANTSAPAKPTVPAADPAALANPEKLFSDQMIAANKAQTKDARIGALGQAEEALTKIEEKLTTRALAFNTKNGHFPEKGSDILTAEELKNLDPVLRDKLQNASKEDLARWATTDKALVLEASKALADKGIGTQVTKEDIVAMRDAKRNPGSRPPLLDGDGISHPQDPVAPGEPAPGIVIAPAANTNTPAVGDIKVNLNKYTSVTGTEANAKLQVALETLGFSTDKGGIADKEVDGVIGKESIKAIKLAVTQLEKHDALPKDYIKGDVSPENLAKLHTALVNPDVLAKLNEKSPELPNLPPKNSRTFDPEMIPPTTTATVAKNSDPKIVAAQEKNVNETKTSGKDDSEVITALTNPKAIKALEDLKVPGMDSDDIKDVQTKLNIPDTGKWDAKTQEAVAKFAKDNNIPIKDFTKTDNAAIHTIADIIVGDGEENKKVGQATTSPASKEQFTKGDQVVSGDLASLLAAKAASLSGVSDTRAGAYDTPEKQAAGIDNIIYQTRDKNDVDFKKDGKLEVNELLTNLNSENSVLRSTTDKEAIADVNKALEEHGIVKNGNSYVLKAEQEKVVAKNNSVNENASLLTALADNLGFDSQISGTNIVGVRDIEQALISNGVNVVKDGNLTKDEVALGANFLKESAQKDPQKQEKFKDLEKLLLENGFEVKGDKLAVANSAETSAQVTQNTKTTETAATR